MISGTVTPDGEPVVPVPVAGKSWQAVIDTGFNGDLELSDLLRPHVNARYQGQAMSLLGGGQLVEEEVYLVDFPFDGQVVLAEATFVNTDSILLGTHLLASYKLLIHFFPDRLVTLERVADG